MIYTFFFRFFLIICYYKLLNIVLGPIHWVFVAFLFHCGFKVHFLMVNAVDFSHVLICHMCTILVKCFFMYFVIGSHFVIGSFDLWGFFFFFGKFWELFTYFRYYPFVNYVALNISSRPKLFIESFGEQNFLILSKSKSTF